MGRPSYTTLKERADAAAEAAAAEELTPQEEARRMKKLIADWEQEQTAKGIREERAGLTERGQIHRVMCVDPHENKLATYISLGWVDQTPSMCDQDPRCCYDAAVESGFPNGYDSIPVDMMIPWKGITARQYTESLLEQHRALRHVQASKAHIRTPEQVQAAKRELPDTFVENPRL